MPATVQNNLFNEPDSAADVAIIGLGPGGLAAALQAARNGKAVVAFTDRREYIRGQRVVLTLETINFLIKQTDPLDAKDRELCLKFILERSIQTKDIERFLYRKLVNYPNVKIVPIDKQTLPIKSVGEDDNVNYIELQNGTKYYCNNILAADGAKHGFADKMNSDLRADIQYTKSPLQERHRYHAVVQLQLKKGEKAGVIRGEDIVEKMQSLAQQGWTHSYQPKKYLLPNAAKTKFYFAGEIPESIFKEEDEATRAAKLKTWAAESVYRQYGITEDQLDYRHSRKTPAKDRLQCTVFDMEMVCSNKILVNLKNGVFAQVGDARRTPNYNLGHGLNDAINGGVAFADAIISTGFSTEEFTQKIHHMDEAIEKRMNLIDIRGNRAKKNSQNNLLNSLDNLISRLQREPANTNVISMLNKAKETLQSQGDLNAMYKAMTEVQPIAAIHKNTAFLYRAYRFFVSIFDSQATLTKTAVILDEAKSHLAAYSNRPVL